MAPESRISRWPRAPVAVGEALWGGLRKGSSVGLFEAHGSYPEGVLRRQVACATSGNRKGSYIVGTFSLLGGGKRDRTADPLNAIQVLSQLSYTP